MFSITLRMLEVHHQLSVQGFKRLLASKVMYLPPVLFHLTHFFCVVAYLFHGIYILQGIGSTIQHIECNSRTPEDDNVPCHLCNKQRPSSQNFNLRKQDLFDTTQEIYHDSTSEWSLGFCVLVKVCTYLLSFPF
jgi:hypothetical protein